MDTIIDPLPDLMTCGGVPVGGHERSGCFAKFFSEKVSSITNSTIIDRRFQGSRRSVKVMIFVASYGHQLNPNVPNHDPVKNQV